MISNEVIVSKVWAVAVPYKDLFRLSGSEAVRAKADFLHIARRFIRDSLGLAGRKAARLLQKTETHFILDPRLGGELSPDNLVLCPITYHGIPHALTDAQAAGLAPGEGRLINLYRPAKGTIIWFPETPAREGLIVRNKCNLEMCL